MQQQCTDTQCARCVVTSPFFSRVDWRNADPIAKGGGPHRFPAGGRERERERESDDVAGTRKSCVADAVVGSAAAVVVPGPVPFPNHVEKLVEGLSMWFGHMYRKLFPPAEAAEREEEEMLSNPENRLCNRFYISHTWTQSFCCLRKGSFPLLLLLGEFSERIPRPHQ